MLHDAVNKIKEKHKEVYLLGFSQGACLVLEYGSKYEVNGIIGFSGGFIGGDGELPRETKTKNVLLCCSSNDPFIPLDRAKKTANIYQKNGAKIKTNFYDGSTHTITEKDIQLAKELIS